MLLWHLQMWHLSVHFAAESNLVASCLCAVAPFYAMTLGCACVKNAECNGPPDTSSELAGQKGAHESHYASRRLHFRQPPALSMPAALAA